MSHERFHERRKAFGRTLTVIQQHQQGHHGWSHFHGTVDRLFATENPAFDRLLETVWAVRPQISDAHLVTLIGAAVRQIALRNEEAIRLFDADREGSTRLEILRNIVEKNENELAKEMCGRSNSFTGARRFLVPQLVIGSFAAKHNLDEVRFLDLGTGMGILPRQLNNRTVYDRFEKDLVWKPWAPVYRHIPLTIRYGVDAHPLPSLEWVRNCYGPSRYYEERFEELLWSLDQTADEGMEVVIRELDVLDLPRLADFIHKYRFNVITCNFVLFQYRRSVQEAVARCVMENIDSPGLFLTMNPSHDLLQPGCRVRGRFSGSPVELRLADASDAHLIGMITVKDDLSLIIGGQPEGRGG